ncbi:MAG: fibronectin type III-like domain-contianing protein, partial [Opitutales bacterium]|nr:fibronectin type III-like domain-contianing protein [Opitutales bacterium]
FGYSELQVTPSGPRTIDVSVRVSNIGQRSGTEVVQLYLTDPVAQVVRPVKELKGFARVTLAPGDSTVQRFSLTESELGYFLPDGSFTFEPGEFILTVGPTGTLSQQVTVSD